MRILHILFEGNASECCRRFRLWYNRCRPTLPRGTGDAPVRPTPRSHLSGIGRAARFCRSAPVRYSGCRWPTFCVCGPPVRPRTVRPARSCCCGSGAARPTWTPGTPSPTLRSNIAALSRPSPRRSPASASASCSRKIGPASDSLRPRALAAHRLQRPRRRRHHRPDRQRRRRRRPRRQAAARLGAAGDRAAWWRGCAAPASKLPPFLVVGGRLHQGKKAIVGEGGGPLGALVRPLPPRIRPRPRHAHPRPATAARPHAGAPRRPPPPACKPSIRLAQRAEAARAAEPWTTTAVRRSPC